MALQLDFIPGLKHIRRFFVQSKYHIYLTLKKSTKKNTKTMKISIFLSIIGFISGYTISAISHRSQLKAGKFAYKVGNAKHVYKYSAVPKMLKMRSRGGSTKTRSANSRFNRFRSHHRARF